MRACDQWWVRRKGSGCARYHPSFMYTHGKPTPMQRKELYWRKKSKESNQCRKKRIKWINLFIFLLFLSKISWICRLNAYWKLITLNGLICFKMLIGWVQVWGGEALLFVSPGPRTAEILWSDIMDSILTNRSFFSRHKLRQRTVNADGTHCFGWPFTETLVSSAVQRYLLQENSIKKREQSQIIWTFSNKNLVKLNLR